LEARVTAEQFLPQFAEALARRLSQPRYDSYFAANCRLRWEDDTLVVGVANLFFMEWLRKNFQADVETTAEEVVGKPTPVKWVIEPELFRAVRAEAAAGAEGVVAPPHAEARQPVAAPEERRWKSLSDFIVGACNRLAYTAARNLIDRVAETPTLLTIHGGPGVGKTHLLEGLFLEVRRTLGDAAALCVSAEEFVNRFSAALAAKQTPAFRRQFRDTYALFIDNIDFLAGKPVFQEELLHTLEALARLGRPVVVTSQVHPRELTDFAPQLLDRLIGGGVYEMELPDHRTRLELLRAKAARLNLALPKEAELYLAEHLRGNVRELEGIVHLLWNLQQVQDKPLTLTQVKEATQSQIRTPLKVVGLADIEKAVCKLLQIDAKTLRTPTRARSVSHARMLAMYLARQHTKASANDIARHFGYKSHSMVIAAEKKVRQWLQSDAPLFAAVDRSPVREFIESAERELGRG
jgi:chromosomal replication initiator protein